MEKRTATPMNEDVSRDDHHNPRELLRLIQCPQCSHTLRTPLRLPCGNTLCQSCLPPVYKRENITYPMNVGRKERFRCPFVDGAKCKDEEHSVGDCGIDITLNKIVDIFAEGVKGQFKPSDYDLSGGSQGEFAQLENKERISENLGHSSELETAVSFLKACMLAEAGELKYAEDSLPGEADGEDANPKAHDELFLQQLTVALRNELDCQVCYALMLSPLTTSCGHTFCRDCITRVLDHSNLCPICRRRVHRRRSVLGVPGNQRVSGIITQLFPKQRESRQLSVTQERDLLHDHSTIPLFVCTLAFPMMPVYLHVFEPRYRLMIRRALEDGGRKFGMVMVNRTSTQQGDLGVTQFMQCGTVLHIDRFELLPDGRSLIEARGISRFKVLEWEMLDGYFVGKTELIEDMSLADEENLEVRETEGSGMTPRSHDPDLEELDRLSTEQLMQISMDFISRRKADSAPWLHQRVLNVYGQPPSDPAVFPYWFGCVLPIFEEERYSLLPTTSVRERLKITAMWVKVLDDMDW